MKLFFQLMDSFLTLLILPLDLEILVDSLLESAQKKGSLEELAGNLDKPVPQRKQETEIEEGVVHSQTEVPHQLELRGVIFNETNDEVERHSDSDQGGNYKQPLFQRILQLPCEREFPTHEEVVDYRQHQVSYCQVDDVVGFPTPHEKIHAESLLFIEQEFGVDFQGEQHEGLEGDEPNDYQEGFLHEGHMMVGEVEDEPRDQDQQENQIEQNRYQHSIIL